MTTQLLAGDAPSVSSDIDALARCWHPIAWSDEVGSKPVAATLLGEPLVAYRTSQGVVVAKDLCLHRGAPLSMGWVEGDELVCAYHGFRYGNDGYCTRVPAHPGLPVSHKLRLMTMPAVERYGIVWARLSPADPLNELPNWEEAEDPTYRRARLPTEDWGASAARMVENFLDLAHFSWIHADTFGNRDHPEIAPYDVARTDYGLHYTYDYLAKNPSFSPLPEEQQVRRHMVYDITLPLAARLVIHYEGDRRHAVMTAASPAGPRHTRVFFFIARNFDHDKTDAELLDWERSILRQDKAMVERQRPEELPLDLSEEFHIKADRASLAYRQELRRLGVGRPFSA
jgi:phenylpropionate dioxygenase-like ring-hydroxylating dioxygenase large terminal subunit